ncbi:MAG: TOBE domain-containing protein, partial [Ilumatobacteraceae bacterium]
MNLLRGRYQTGDGGGTLRLGSATIKVAGAPASLADYNGREVAVGIRPEHISEGTAASGDNTLSGKVTVREGLGSEVILHIEVDADGVDTEAVRDAMESEKAGQTVSARLPPRTPLKLDETAHLVVDPEQLHLFDLESGLAIR